MSKEPPSIDPVEVELNLLNEIVGDNIVIIIHENGMSIMMDESLEERTDEQMKMFSRMYVAARPSFVLRVFLMVEIFLLLLMEETTAFFKSLLKKD